MLLRPYDVNPPAAVSYFTAVLQNHRPTRLQNRIALLLLLALPPLLRAQMGDRRDGAGEVQKSLVPKELIPPSPPLSPAEALKSFRLAPGIRIDVVASEPLVEDPVAAVFGPDGRLWVVEMRGYMTDFEGSTEDAPVGRVVVLSDADGDGRFDHSTLFLDHLILPRALALFRDGLLVGAPPNLKLWRDTNGDGQADEATVIATDFGVQVDPRRPELASPERAPNGLLWSLDNWIYCANYTTKLRYTNGRWASAPTSFRGEWGISQDDFGHLYYNSNSDQLRVDVVASRYLERNPNYPRPAGANVKIPENQLVWPVRVTPGTNRAYRPQTMREGKLKEFTAACAPWIYRADLFPREYYGNAFVAEPAANLIKRNLVTAADGTLIAREAYHEREFIASTDERFRPVNLLTGPDGALYVVDFYRGVIEDRISLTSYLRQQAEDRGLISPQHLGRIYRVAPADQPPARLPGFAAQPAQWIENLSHANSWWRETAQRRLIEHGDHSLVPALRKLALGGREPLGRLHALCTLDGLGQIDRATVTAALRDPEPVVRAAAVRLCEPFFSGQEKAAIVASLLKLKSDPSPEVQLQLVLTLGEAREVAIDAAAAALVRSARQNVFLRDAFYSGLFGRELPLLEHLIADAGWPANDSEADALLGGIARGIFNSRNPESAARVLALAAAQSSAARDRQIALLDGAANSAGITGRKPVKFGAPPAGLDALKKIGDSAVDARLAKIDRLVAWPGKPGTRPDPAIPPLTAAEQTRFETGRALFAGTCAACHQLHGRGLDGLAPPLADSEWVNGPAERMARIALHGVRGRLSVDGRTYNLDMPPFGSLTDEQIAAILTYARREWGNSGTPVEPALVQILRKQTASRNEAWSQAELLKIP